MGALTLIGAALSAADAVASSRAEAQTAEFNAEAAQQQAARERDIAARDAAAERRRGSRELAAVRARRAGRGVTLQGSPLLTEEVLAGDVELAALEAVAEGEGRAQTLNQRAALERARASARRAAGLRRAGSTLLTTASGYGSGGITIF